MMRRLLLLGLFTAALIGALAAPAAAQDDAACPALVRAVIESAALECSALLPGQACYGHGPIDALLVGEAEFERPGAIIPAGQVLRLNTGALQVPASAWGVALARVETGDPGVTLTYALFGEAALTNRSANTVPVFTATARVTFAGGANVRAEPVEGGELTARLNSGERRPITGRLADESWLRLFLDGASGWVRADLVRVEGDLAVVPVVDPADAAPESLGGPLLDLELSTAQDDAPCAAAPESGLLIQSDAAPVVVTVNRVRIALDGAVYLQARAQGELIASALSGVVEITSGGETVSLRPGERTRVRWDAAANAPGAPRRAEPAIFIEMRSLPVALLPRPVDPPAFNLIDVVTLTPPDGADPLDAIPFDGRCTVAAFNDEGRLRTGPGREYAVLDGLRSGESVQPDARANGADGWVWWRLREGIWARADVVLAAGDCSPIPFIDPPPLPTPTPAP